MGQTIVKQPSTPNLPDGCIITKKNQLTEYRWQVSPSWRVTELHIVEVHSDGTFIQYCSTNKNEYVKQQSTQMCSICNHKAESYNFVYLIP